MTWTRAFAAGAAALLLHAGAQAAGWVFTDLGVGTAYAINDAGQIVGADGNAVEYVDGTQVLLPFLPASHFSGAVALNESGVSVGYTLIQQPDDSDRSTATIFNATTAVAIPKLAGYADQQANDINDAGTVVGTSYNSLQQPGARMGFVVAHGVLTPIGSLAGGTYSVAASINTAGDIAGSSGHVDAFGNCPDCTAVLVHNGVMTALGLPPGTSSSFGGQINDAGEIIGNAVSSATGLPLAFSLSGGQAVLIPNLPGANTNTAASINNKGQIVGVSSVASGGVTTNSLAYLYSGGRLTNLSRLAVVARAGFTSLVPLKINDAGQIVGTAMPRRSQEPHAFLLTPVARSQDR